MGRATSTFFAQPPGALGRSQKVKYHLISITKSISKICVPNFVCVLINERYKAYQRGYSFCRLGHVQEVRLWGAAGAQGVKYYFISNMVNWHINSKGMTSRTECKYNFYLLYGQTSDLGVRKKGQISLNFDYYINSKIFIPNFVCVLTNKG